MSGTRTTQKQAVVTFKADESLMEALQRIPNRSLFIRSAVLAALENTCPLCLGTGILTPEQRAHWESFSLDHEVKECKVCHEWHLVCSHDPKKKPHQRKKTATRKSQGGSS